MAEPKRARRRVRSSARGDQSREAILDVAERHFGERGFRGASTAAIADDVGMSDPGLLHHYGSKEGLLKALLRERFSFDAPKLKDGEKISTAELLGMVELLVKENCRRHAAVKLTMVLLGESIAVSHPSHDYFRDRYGRIRQIMIRHIQDAQSAKEIASGEDPEKLANVLIAVMDGLQLQWLFDPAVDMVGAVITLNRLLMTALNMDGAEEESDLPVAVAAARG